MARVLCRLPGPTVTASLSASRANGTAAGRPTIGLGSFRRPAMQRKHPESGYRANGMFGVRQHGRGPGRRGRRQHGSGPRRDGLACQLRLTCEGPSRAGLGASARGGWQGSVRSGVCLTGVRQPTRSARNIDRDFPSGDAQLRKLGIPLVAALHRLLHVSGPTAEHGDALTLGEVSRAGASRAFWHRELLHAP